MAVLPGPTGRLRINSKKIPAKPGLNDNADIYVESIVMIGSQLDIIKLYTTLSGN